MKLIHNLLIEDEAQEVYPCIEISVVIISMENKTHCLKQVNLPPEVRHEVH